MRERDLNRKMFHRGHYEVIAARIREQLEPILKAEHFFDDYAQYNEQVEKSRLQSGALINLAISLAKRLQLDNEEFDPVIFLNRCSPDPEQYPLSELWSGVDQTELVEQ